MEVSQRVVDLISVLSPSLFYLCLAAVKWALLSLMEGYGSSDTADERAPALVRGKSFISVDLLGQVDWSWASRFTLFLYNPCPRPSLPHLPPFSFLLLSADTIPAITANSKDDGTKILLCYKSRDLVPQADTIKPSFWGRGLKFWGYKSCCFSTAMWMSPD